MHEALPKVPLGIISRQLDDMLFTLFNPHIVNYELPRGFTILKFTVYDGLNDPFDHLRHF